MADGNEENNEYKDHYKQVLMDMLGQRNKGLFEAEEAIEGFASTSQRPRERSHSSQMDSHSSSACVDSEVASFERSIQSYSDVRTTLPSRFATFDDILEDPAVGSDRLLYENRRSPEGDQQLLITDQKPEKSRPSVKPRMNLVTPEPSLIEISLRNPDLSPVQGAEENSEPVNNEAKTSKNKWKFLKGIKTPWSPR